MKPDKYPHAGLTLVIPVYNRARIVERTLRSVENQSCRPDEVILVDNGSSDGSLSILEDWGRRMRGAGWNVRVLSEPKRGASCARQRGLEHCSLPYVMFFDSDDIMDPRHIERIKEDFAGDPSLDLTVWNVCYVNATDGRKRPRRILPAHPLENHMVQGLLCTAAYAVRTSFIRDAGGWNRSVGGWDDLELGLRLLLQRPRLRISREVRVYAIVQADSITGLTFAHRCGDWEHTLDIMQASADSIADPRLRTHLLRLLAYRRINLAAHYHREGRDDLASPLRAGTLQDNSLGFRQRLLLRIAYMHTSIGLPAAGGIYPPLLR